jgi:hypothetical protein
MPMKAIFLLDHLYGTSLIETFVRHALLVAIGAT